MEQCVPRRPESCGSHSPRWPAMILSFRNLRLWADPTLYLPDSPHSSHPDPSLTGSCLYLKCRYFVHQECFHISFDFSKYILLILRFLGVPLNFAHKTSTSLASPSPGPDSHPHCNWAAVCDKWDKLEACDLWGEDTKDISAFIVVSWITLSGGNL